MVTIKSALEEEKNIEVHQTKHNRTSKGYLGLAIGIFACPCYFVAFPIISALLGGASIWTLLFNYTFGIFVLILFLITLAFSIGLYFVNKRMIGSSKTTICEDCQKTSELSREIN